ncbi:PqqA peptide cyclase [subsurface metagenome]
MSELCFKSKDWKREPMKDKIKRLIKKNPRVYKWASVSYKTSKMLFGRKNGKWNYFKCMYSATIGLDKSLGHPILLTIEPTNICDHRCPVCETGSGILGRKKRMTNFDEFKYILDQFDNNLRELMFYFMGEPFLNKDAYKMIRYATDKGIYVSSCTNGVKVEPKELVESSISEVSFQLGGMTQKTHEKYRVGGNLAKLLKNLEETIEWKERLNKDHLKVIAGFILMKHNEDEINDFISYTKKVGVDEYQVIDSCVRTVEQGKEFLPSDKTHWIYDEKEFKKGNLISKVRPNNYCEWIYFTVTIQVNGDVVPCCRDPHGRIILGNVFKENIYNIWNNEKYRKLRKAVTTRQRELELCRLCPGYGAP